MSNSLRYKIFTFKTYFCPKWKVLKPTATTALSYESIRYVSKSVGSTNNHLDQVSIVRFVLESELVSLIQESSFNYRCRCFINRCWCWLVYASIYYSSLHLQQKASVKINPSILILYSSFKQLYMLYHNVIL